MAPSQNHDMETLQYAHKKFNYGYSHKKLGLCFTRRNSQERGIVGPSNREENIKITKKSGKALLFRPYALHNRSSKETIQSLRPKESEVQATSPTDMSEPSCCVTSNSLEHIEQQSQEEYVLKLQRQCAALYIKHVMQFYENGHGWRTVHPNAINNPSFYQNF